MAENDDLRIDKFLWAVRIYKTRSLAADECRKGKVLIDSIPVKPSRIIKSGEIFIVKKLPVIYTYKVKAITTRRLPAKLVEEYVENITSREELDKLDFFKLAGVERRDRGAGRPTKKERRVLGRIKGER